MVRALRLQTMRERRAYFLRMLMFKCIHGLAPHYFCNDVTMYVDINGYDTRSVESMDLYWPRCSKEIYKRIFRYKGSFLWNQLLSYLKESVSMIDFKRDYRLLYGWRLSELLMSLRARSIFHMKPRHADIILCRPSTSHIHFYPTLVFVLSFIYGCFIYDLYLCVYMNDLTGLL